MLVLALFLVGCASTSNILEECKKCNLEVAVFSNKNAANLTYDQINNFFCTLNDSCRNNVEFSEVSNEALFQVFLNKPELWLKSLNENSSLSFDFILQQLSQPINDGIDLQKTHSNVAKIKKYSGTRGKVLESLHKAIAKN